MDTQLTESDELTRIWDEKPEVIRSFIEIRPQYEQLCSEINYILTKRMKDSGIEYSAITNRAKTLKSFAEKLSRKHYDKPFKEVSDIAGVRLVYLYKNDFPAIEKIIKTELEVLEKVDKVAQQDTDKFGYGAIHYLVNLGRKSSGARYDDLKGLVCEIQVRTVLQDAWAIIDHHLSYKHESDVPKVLKRKVNCLSGLFETADDQFDQVRTEREEYKKTVRSKRSNTGIFLDQDINLDTLFEFMKWKFPDMKTDINNKSSSLLTVLIGFGFAKLSDLNNLLDRTEKARETMNTEKKPNHAVGQVARAMALDQPTFRDDAGWNENDRKLFKKYEHLCMHKE